MSQIVTTPDGQQHEFPDEASPQQIRAALAGYNRGAPAEASRTGVAPAQSIGLREYIKPALPYVAGAGAAMLAPEVAGPNLIARALANAGIRIGAAGLGGALGETGGQALVGQPLNPRQIAGAGGQQALLQGISEILPVGTAGLRTGAEALRARAAKKAIEDVRAAAAAGDTRAQIAGALNQTRAERGAASDVTKQLYRDAKQAGTTISPREAVTPLEDRIDELYKLRDPKAQAMARTLQGRRNSFLEMNLNKQGKMAMRPLRAERVEIRRALAAGEITEHQAASKILNNRRKVTQLLGNDQYLKPMNPIRAKQLTQFHQNVSNEIYNKLGSERLPRSAASDAETSTRIAQGLRGALDAKVPGIRAAEDLAQSKIVEAQNLRRLQKSQPEGKVRDIEQARREAVAAQAARNPVPPELGIHAGGLYVRPPNVATTADILASMAGNPWVQALTQLATKVPFLANDYNKMLQGGQ